MKNRINLSKYHLRTDLIIDDASIKGKIIKYDNVTINKVSKDGNYITITFEDITNYEDREKVGKLLEKELKELFKKNNIKNVVTSIFLILLVIWALLLKLVLESNSLKILNLDKQSGLPM